MACRFLHLSHRLPESISEGPCPFSSLFVELRNDGVHDRASRPCFEQSKDEIGFPFPSDCFRQSCPKMEGLYWRGRLAEDNYLISNGVPRMVLVKLGHPDCSLFSGFTSESGPVRWSLGGRESAPGMDSNYAGIC